ncbi:hypothetical protein C8R46DRAFT_290957 [Mycena filopes]|nr:hypothetical protein C8R46DRAFT_290957 [Mycena filopes]
MDLVSTTTADPIFPEDLERKICEVLVEDTRDMCGPISLVASRFHAWMKDIKLWTVVVRESDDWAQRINDCILPNAGLIRVLVLDLSFHKDDDRRCVYSGEELSSIRRLLGTSRRLRHLAVTWNIWACLEQECAALRLQSLYLIWDGAGFDGTTRIEAPTLEKLQHPAALEYLTMFAPLSLAPGWSPWREPDSQLPVMAHCTNLAYVTYAANLLQVLPWTGKQYLKGCMTVALRAPKVDGMRGDDSRNSARKDRIPNFSTLHMSGLGELLREWLKKVEGRKSLLDHPPPRM